MGQIMIVKKDGRRENFDFKKIEAAVGLSAGRVRKTLTKDFVEDLKTLSLTLVDIEVKENKTNEITVLRLHTLVENALLNLDKDLYAAYAGYRDYKKKHARCMGEQNKEVESILMNGDKENANKDSMLNSTQKELIGGVVSKNYAINFELPEDVAKQHEKGFIYVHDLRDFIFGGINCCLFNMGNVLKGGFELNGVKYREPGSIASAIDIMADLIISASSQQFGGFTVPEPDRFLAPYCEKSYKKYVERAKKRNIPDPDGYAMERIEEDLLQGFDGIDHKLNTINNALGW